MARNDRPLVIDSLHIEQTAWAYNNYTKSYYIVLHPTEQIQHIQHTHSAIGTGSRHCYDLPAPVLEDDKLAFDLLARVEANDVRGVD